MKKCPYCAEEIQDDALKCRYCGEYLDKAAKAKEGRKRIFKGCFLGCLIVLVVSILALIAMAYLGYFTFKHISKQLYPGPGGDFYYYRGGIVGLFSGFIDAIRAFIEQIMNFFHVGVKVV